MRIQFIPVQTEAQVQQLASIANEVWHEHFASILIPEQIDYMVAKFQSISEIMRQIGEEGYQYIFLKLNGIIIGYMGIHPEKDKLFLSKLYILKSYRGNGYASETFAFLEKFCLENALSAIYLTVNRHNDSSIKVYEAKGFLRIREQVADIGNGFVMDDYVMEKKVK